MPVEMRKEGHVAYIVLNRPEARNAINGEMSPAPLWMMTILCGRIAEKNSLVLWALRISEKVRSPLLKSAHLTGKANSLLRASWRE